MADATPPSKSQVERAGKALRLHLTGRSAEARLSRKDALAIVDRYRRSHRRPMTTANVALRGYCSRYGLQGHVTQRLKRLNTILDKLTRETELNLSRMQDFGGCRVVLQNLDELWQLYDLLMKRHPKARVSDYVTNPRPSGYRAVHVIAEWGKQPRHLIEIQLRTTLMHLWADMVERASGARGINYKRDGNDNFHRWARNLSQILEHIEKEQQIPPGLMDDYRRSERVLDNHLEA